MSTLKSIFLSFTKFSGILQIRGINRLHAKSTLRVRENLPRAITRGRCEGVPHKIKVYLAKSLSSNVQKCMEILAGQTISLRMRADSRKGKKYYNRCAAFVPLYVCQRQPIIDNENKVTSLLNTGAEVWEGRRGDATGGINLVAITTL